VFLQAAGLTLLTIHTIAQEPATLTASIRRQVIDSTCNALLRNYVYPEKARTMSDRIRQKHLKGGYDTLVDPRRLANMITRDVRTVQADKHLAIRYDPDLEKRIRTFVATAQKDKTELENERRENFFFRKVEILKGNIGYIVFTNFADTGELSRKTVRAALQFAANADALILDLRNNFGGRPEMAKEITNYFFSQPQLTGKTFNRISNNWAEEWVGDQPAVTAGLLLAMPLYILTSERTFSSAEGLAYNLQHLKNAIVVGDTTRGGAHTTRSFALGNGFVGFIPFTRGEHVVTKTDWEGTGVIPTIAISEDSALLKAQELILEQRLKIVTDATEKRKVQWLLNDLQTKLRDIFVPQETLRRYTGAFEEFLFTLEDGKLFCRNTHQRDKKDRLIAISDTLFKIDDQSQVEFVRERNGVVKSIRLLWNDGWVDIVGRSN